MNIAHDPRRAAAMRDHAARRVRRVTALAIASATALTGIFAAMAAASTHPKKTVTVATRTKRTASAARSTAPVTAPTPTLVQNGSAAAAPPASSSSSAPAVSQSSAPPVVVSGGS